MGKSPNIIPVAEGYSNSLARAKSQCSENPVPGVMFLNACDGLAEVIGKLMKVGIVEKDIKGNVKKVRSTLEKYKADSIQDALLKESEDGCKSARVSMLWLNRTIMFTSKLVAGSIETDRPFKETVMLAYEQTLKPYHGKTVARVVKMAMAFVPKREKIVVGLLKGAEMEKEEDLVPPLRKMGEDAEQLCKIIDGFYRSKSFDVEQRAE